MENYLKTLNSFRKNIQEARLLLEFSTNTEDETKNNVVLKSFVVISVAYWERYVEDLLIEGCDFIADGLRNPLDLPEITKQAVVDSTVLKHETNLLARSTSIWGFSGDGWTKQYKSFVEKVVGSFNTANSKNVKEAFWKVFGIRDVFQNWSSTDPLAPMDTDVLDKFINKRHEIAHGSSEAMKGFDSLMVDSSSNLLLNLAEHVEEVVWAQITNIVQKSASEYGLKTKYIYDIINYFKSHGFSAVTNKTFQKISQTANSNYKKLAYEPWGLLKILSPSDIRPTPSLQKFLKGELVLPEHIVVLKNQIALPKSTTRYISFQDLEDQYCQ
ncbi:MAG: hypothetical protein GX416_10760 [Bacteroidales bacterium]|nr:hypothetical protein [Bacteroidales bacterium]